jgi:hypothetical protein
MGILGQLPHAPDELPGHQVTSGEPPIPGGKAGELPALGSSAGSVSISLSLAAVTEPSDEQEAGAE